MTIQESSFLKFIREWPLLLCIVLLLMGAMFWSSNENLPSVKDVRDAVGSDLERSLGLTIENIEILQVRRNGDEGFIVSVLLQNDLLDLRFGGSQRRLLWEGVNSTEGVEFSVTDYVHYLRYRNEQEAVDFVRLIQTAQVAAKTREGIYLPISELEKEGFLPSNLINDGPSGYLLSADVSEFKYKVFLVPADYPRSASCSFYGDNALEVRGRDMRGKRASPEDPVVVEKLSVRLRGLGLGSNWKRSEQKVC